MMNRVLWSIVGIVFGISMLSGCGQVDRHVAQWTGHSKHCVEGVKYIQFTNGATVMYNIDGSIVTCIKGDTKDE